MGCCFTLLDRQLKPRCAVVTSLKSSLKMAKRFLNSQPPFGVQRSIAGQSLTENKLGPPRSDMRDSSAKIESEKQVNEPINGKRACFGLQSIGRT